MVKVKKEIALAIIAILITIIGIWVTIFYGSNDAPINIDANIDASNSSQSNILVGSNSQQTISYITQNFQLNNSTLNELCSEFLNRSCYTLPIDTKTDCINNITAADGITGEGILIDDCDVLVTKLKDDETPVKSGTVSLWIKFSEIKQK